MWGALLTTGRIFSSRILAFACLFHTASPGTVGPPKWAKSLPRGAYMAHLVRTNRHWAFERISGLQASGFPVDRFMQVSARSSWRNDFFSHPRPPPRPAPSGYRALVPAEEGGAGRGGAARVQRSVGCLMCGRAAATARPEGPRGGGWGGVAPPHAASAGEAGAAGAPHGLRGHLRGSGGLGGGSGEAFGAVLGG